QAYAMVSIYGLNKRLGNISYYDSQGRDMFTKPYSDDTAKMIDEEVSTLIESQYQRALSLLTENRDKLIQLAEKLLTDEVIFKENLEAIFGKRPWEPLDIQVEEEVIVQPTDSADEVPKESTEDGPTASLDGSEGSAEQNSTPDPSEDSQ
ncbi:MAG: peptidase M41, partial [Bacteroidota bacterium]